MSVKTTIPTVVGLMKTSFCWTKIWRVHGSSPTVRSDLFHTDLLYVPWESMHAIPNRIRELDESHSNCTVATFRHFEYEQCIVRNTVTIHPLDVSADFNARYLIIREPAFVRAFLLRNDTRLIIVDGHHRHDGIYELHNDPNPEYQSTREPLPMFLNFKWTAVRCSQWI